MPAVMFASSELIINCDLKHPNHLVVRQPYAIQIIQLVEGPPPPPHPILSLQSQSSSSSSSYPSGSESDEYCSSYCSSIVTPDDVDPDRTPIPWTDDTYSLRMKRVHAWRDGFVKAICDPSESRTPLKRKTHPHPADDDAISHTSKRSRISRLSAHPCPACDTLFPSLSSLQKHGRDPEVPEACRAAVEYNFE